MNNQDIIKQFCDKLHHDYCLHLCESVELLALDEKDLKEYLEAKRKRFDNLFLNREWME